MPSTFRSTTFQVRLTQVGDQFRGIATNMKTGDYVQRTAAGEDAAAEALVALLGQTQPAQGVLSAVAS
jgi:hypothetical protein